jgi:serine phosphatase RsbU (regulator of sigma subunit)
MADHREEDTTLLTKSTIHGVRSPESGRAHYLLVVEGASKGQRIPVGNNPIVIGRSPPADVVLADQRISRNHCRVCIAFEELIVVDLESSNGTFIEGKRLTGGAPLPVGSRLQLGSSVLEHEWRIRKEVEDSQELDRDLEQASQYIQSLLPPPLVEGAIRSDWSLVPCARLGGDAFGYRYLDPTHFAIYLIDVSGHGTGAAMHAVSVINVLRQSALPDTDFLDPASVLRGVNTMFRMETHGHMYLTIWYGVYDTEARRLAYASAGHHAAFLVEPARDRPIALQTRNPAIGVADRATFNAGSVDVAPGSMLYVFSDGVFEITTKAGEQGDLEGFVELLLAAPISGTPESRRLLEAVRERAGIATLEDDFTLMAFTFLERPALGTAPDATWPSRG